MAIRNLSGRKIRYGATKRWIAEFTPRAGAAIYGLDRMSEKGWQELEALIPTTPEAKPKKKPARFIQMQQTKVNDPWL